MGETACPNEARLQAFSVGDLPVEQFESVAQHVMECADCAQRSAALDAYSDDLVEELRAAASDSTVDCTVPPPLLDAARLAFESVNSQSGNDEMVFDRGSVIARKLAQGPLTLGRFTLLEALGAGSFGSVFKAHDTELDRTVALKVQRAGQFDSSDEQSRFLREARSVAQLNHAHIISLYETSELADGGICLVTEFVSGRTLEKYIQDGPGSPRAVAELLAQLADALHYAHDHGVIHRDIKPSNVIIDDDGHPHIMDFGLAKREEGEATMTSVGAVMGTPAYMSPELALGESHDVDARSDIFSLGIVLYEMLTGHRPFQGNRRMVMLQIIEDDPRAPRLLNEKVPRDLETICLKALAKNPGRRYTTAAELAEDLRRFHAGDPIHARPIGRGERLWHWSRRNPVAVSVILAIVAGSAVGFWHLTRLSQQLVRDSARDSARMHAHMLEEVNRQYSATIVERMREEGIVITHDYQSRDGTIPLPATFLTELGDRLSAGTSGMVVRHYSDHPFRFRTTGGPRDDFEREALEQLRQKPDEPFLRFENRGTEGYRLRYATARLMEASCIDCHNTHWASTKTDWAVGDVRGVLEIIRPLDEHVAQIGAHLSGTFALTGISSLLFLMLTIGVILVSDRRRRARRRTPAASPL